ncbi:DUF4169 family protein [Tianweitania sp. BSSL-BM11]|uniref:DUF4169 family protein n=1 Tax=Tianweitania aestuarii TaxID=2814886 RepID=A0ABS5RYZ2_9HYPH|nr:DUF4169 family protein [Tianweitania aestuarii]MBS9720882.1 DUF4169 family protein [Tianweitania aestuarii]
MGDIVNLRTIRKQRDRAEDARKADENRARFGRTKAEKQAEAKAGERAQTQLDNHRRET